MDLSHEDVYDNQDEIPDTMSEMSEMVQTMASSVYMEFQRMISAHGDGVVEGLMPQLVAILENWDVTIKEKQRIQLDLDLCKEDNEQLLSQYDKEKNVRRATEQRCMEIEDVAEEERKETQRKGELSEKNLKVTELKAKNYQDQVARFEDKEVETKREYDKLHTRYSELFKTHIDYMERSKLLMSQDKGEESPGVSSKLKGLTLPSPTSDTPPAPFAVTSDDAGARGEGVQTSSALRMSAGEAFDELHEESMVDSDGDLTGMTREVENLIQENQELVQTKNALNVVKDDLITRVDELSGELDMVRSELHLLTGAKVEMTSKIASVESDLRQAQEELTRFREAKIEEDELPTAQRKRFTRVEMARVLMERNQYKEKLMELQEAIRWQEMVRATRVRPEDSTEQRDKKSGIWTFFSNLFSAGKPRKGLLASGALGASLPVGDPSRPRRNLYELGEKAKTYDFLQEDALTETGRKQREQDRKEHYRQVQAHVAKDDGRTQAYGWSLPSHQHTSPLSVPVPVYCRPLVTEENASVAKLWCAAPVLNTYAKTKDGASVVGASIFYSDTSGGGDREDNVADSPREEEQLSPGVNSLDREIKDHQTSLKEIENRQSSSFVWLCTTVGSASEINIINASNPAEVLDTVTLPSTHVLSVACIPGATEKDYPSCDDHRSLPTTGEDQPGGEISASDSSLSFVQCRKDTDSEPTVPSATGQSEFVMVNRESASTIQPTMWMGAQDGKLYIHSAINDFRTCLKKVELKEAILNITHSYGKVFVGLASGSIAVFHRSADGSWCTQDYHLVGLGDLSVVVRCLATIANKYVWAGFQNRIKVVNVQTLKVEKTFVAHLRDGSQVRLLAWAGDGVWVSLRLESTIRLFHAYTHDHLQDVDVEPCLTKILGTGKLGYMTVRVSALEISCKRLWIGTSQGAILSMPLVGHTAMAQSSDSFKSSSELAAASDMATLGTKSPSKSSSRLPGTAVKVYCDTDTDSVTPASYIPYCDVPLTQLSFHGHQDPVKFFVTLSGSGSGSADGDSGWSSNTQLVMSGGEGYVDFRVGYGSDQSLEIPKEDGESPQKWSHLIVWEVSKPDAPAQPSA